MALSENVVSECQGVSELWSKQCPKKGSLAQDKMLTNLAPVEEGREVHSSKQQVFTSTSVTWTSSRQWALSLNLRWASANHQGDLKFKTPPPPPHTCTCQFRTIPKQLFHPFPERNTWYGSQLLLGRRSSKKPFLMSKNENESINILKIAPKFFGQCDLSSAHSLGILMLQPRLATLILGIGQWLMPSTWR